ncbi:hypothetical protein GGI35DRAFT_487266 [Trichoderma velutinum]
MLRGEVYQNGAQPMLTLCFYKVFGEIRTAFIADLDLGEVDPSSATLEKQAEDFEHDAMLRDYTDILDGLDLLHFARMFRV